MVSWDTRRLSSLGYWIFSHPETCSGDQSSISLLTTILRNRSWVASRHCLGAEPTPTPHNQLRSLGTQHGHHVECMGGEFVVMIQQRNELALSQAESGVGRGGDMHILLPPHIPDSLV